MLDIDDTTRDVQGIVAEAVGTHVQPSIALM